MFNATLFIPHKKGCVSVSEPSKNCLSGLRDRDERDAVIFITEVLTEREEERGWIYREILKLKIA